jgi:hypothetical protein
MRVAQSDKHDSLLHCVINYHGKKFYGIGPGFSHHIFAEVEFNHLAALSFLHLAPKPRWRCCNFAFSLKQNNQPGNVKGGSITVPLTSCLTGLD